MLSPARILARHPKILRADELSLGLASLILDRLFEAVRGAADAGLGVLLVEQHVSKALQYSDRVYVLRRGEIVLSGLEPARHAGDRDGLPRVPVIRSQSPAHGL